MVNKVLDILKDSKSFISGEDIAKKLNISRAGVWKNIEKLRNMGYVITSVTNKGYLLTEDKLIFNQIEIEKEIKTALLGKKVYFFEEITSTNDYAKDMANNIQEEGTIVIANNQTKGRGRLERAWISDKGGIFLSLILKPNIQLFNIMQITLLASISICDAIKKLTLLDAKIKWPNDIIINNKKVGGILTEVIAQVEKISTVILGIGINVNNEKFSLDLQKKATSIFLENNKTVSKASLIGCFLEEFEKKYLIYKEKEDFNLFLEEYKKLCLNIGKEVKVIHNKKEMLGKVIDISNIGEIILKTNNNEIKIISGEVLLKNINGEYI